MMINCIPEKVSFCYIYFFTLKEQEKKRKEKGICVLLTGSTLRSYNITPEV